jgi:hypothetical protein
LRTIIFTGPTLGADEGQRLLPAAEFRGPAECGDVYAAARDGVSVIGLIDGYFEQRLSVWHKEILWALAAGVKVIGGASMGALRAAELAPFGMDGVGTIYQWIVDGIIEDDDEVAVAHEAAERGFAVRSEAMVNLRATFAQAEREQIISADTRAKLVDIGKRLFYADRTLAAVLTRASAASPPFPELDPLRSWLARAENRVDQKRRDALAVLERIGQLTSTGLSPAPARFHFEYTEAWHELSRRVDAGSGGRNG